MRIVIVGGGIAAVYIANSLMEKAPESEVVIVSDEKHPPYDRIHLCKLVEDCNCVDSIELELHPNVKLELDQKIISIDPAQKRVFSEHAAFHYDKLIIATGSVPKSLFDISHIENAATFRSQSDCEAIAQGMVGKNVIIVGAGPIALELLDTLMRSDAPQSITLLVRKNYLYSEVISREGLVLIQGIFEADSRVSIRFGDQIVDKEVEGNV
ncbi:MAG: NAD(P)/FAD-dependent oxidoreductase, partial [Sulfuricurvum sp.]|uniref:FAD-dependent oxidoreductase n=1 Tax=Sulfuricurvum sp. TaxID=2025608 RepID=UPI0025F031EF